MCDVDSHAEKLKVYGDLSWAKFCARSLINYNDSAVCIVSLKTKLTRIVERLLLARRFELSAAIY